MASNRIDLSDALWTKSSYSNGDGGECVEVASDFPGAALWRKSTYSNGDGGDCDGGEEPDYEDAGEGGDEEEAAEEEEQ